MKKVDLFSKYGKDMNINREWSQIEDGERARSDKEKTLNRQKERGSKHKERSLALKRRTHLLLSLERGRKDR